MTATFDIAFFGDSLTDDGISFQLSLQTLAFGFPPPGAGYEERFSNGIVHTEYLADLTGLEGESYAISSARAVGSRSYLEFLIANALDPFIVAPGSPALQTDLNLGAQVARAAPGDGTTQAIIYVGNNDYANFVPTTLDPLAEIEALIGDVIAAHVDAVFELRAKGYGEIFVYNLPQQDFFPALAAADPLLARIADPVVAAHNAGLEASVGRIPGVEIVDLNAFTTFVATDQETFGFIAPPLTVAVDVTGPGLPTLDEAVLAEFDEDQILFWDPLHFSTALHGAVGSFGAAAITTGVAFLEADGNLAGGDGVETVFGGAGATSVAAGAGDDSVFGGLGDDRLALQGGADIGAGGDGADFLGGGAGNDVLAGNSGDDVLRGGAGDDVLVDGLGSDRAFGGAGDDTFIYIGGNLIGGALGADRDFFDGRGGTDTLVIAVDAETEARIAPIEGEDFVIAAVGLVARDIEEVVFVDRLDLGALDAEARLVEADIWGLV